MTRTAPKNILMTGLAWTIILAVAAAIVVPIAWILAISLKPPVEAFRMPPEFFFKPILDNHIHIWTQTPFPRYLTNSLIVSIGTPLFSVPFGAMAAYAFSRRRTRTSQKLLYGLLAMRMFPALVLIIPFFSLAQTLGLADNVFFLLVAYVAFNQPFTTWLLYGFFVEIPRELDEAALIDGATYWRSFWVVIVPLVRPGLATAAIFSFTLAWSEFFIALALTSSRAKTMTVAAVEYQGELIQYWSYSAAAMVAIVIPVVVILLPLQKHFVRGLSFGAVKG